MRRTTIFVATAAAIVALTAGFALASIALSSTNQQAGGNYVSATGAVTGLAYTVTVLGATTNPAPAAPSGSASSPQAVAAGANVLCLNTCTAGDLAEQVTYTFTTSMTGSVQISVQVTASANGGTTTLFVKQAATAVGGTLVLTWDLGSTASTLTAVTLADQQCATASCP